jgi:hypothetical protein
MLSQSQELQLLYTYQVLQFTKLQAVDLHAVVRPPVNFLASQLL